MQNILSILKKSTKKIKVINKVEKSKADYILKEIILRYVKDKTKDLPHHPNAIMLFRYNFTHNDSVGSGVRAEKMTLKRFKIFIIRTSICQSFF